MTKTTNDFGQSARGRTSRRAFLTAAGVAAGIATTAEAFDRLDKLGKGVTIVQSLWDLVLRAVGYRVYDRGLITQLFGSLDGYVAYAGGQLEAFGQVHPDNVSAAHHVAQIWPLADLSQQHALTVCADDRVAFDNRDNLILIGGPISNDLVRQQFQYRGKVTELVRMPTILKAHISIFCHRRRCERRPARRYLDGKLHTAPGYYIEGPGTRLVPELGRNDFLKSDYLLISRVPNVIRAKKAAEVGLHGKTIISFQGVHGTALRHVDVLLSDRDTLGQVVSAVPASGFFQLIAKINLQHDHLRKTSEPDGKFQLVDIREVGIS
jgi:hypothetical protein